MGLDARSIQTLIGCHPVLIAKATAAAAEFAAQTGSFFDITSGLRTYLEQHALYMQGRDGDSRPIVTNADAGYSNHNFGMAFDCEPTEAGSSKFIPDWNTAHPHWHILVQCMKDQGLAWGGDWKNMKGDLDHFQLANVTATPTAADREAYIIGGLQAVWAMYPQDQIQAQVTGHAVKITL